MGHSGHHAFASPSNLARFSRSLTVQCRYSQVTPPPFQRWLRRKVKWLAYRSSQAQA